MSIHLKYFVLKPRGTGDYAKASRTAMRVFAAEIEQSDPALANDIKAWVYEEERKIITEAAGEAHK